MIAETSGNPLPPISTSPVEARPNPKPEKSKGSKIRSLFNDFLGLEAKKAETPKTDLHLSRSTSNVGVNKARDDILLKTSKEKSPRRRVQSLTISKGSDIIRPTEKAGNEDIEWSQLLKNRSNRAKQHEPDPTLPPTLELSPKKASATSRLKAVGSNTNLVMTFPKPLSAPMPQLKESVSFKGNLSERSQSAEARSYERQRRVELTSPLPSGASEISKKIKEIYTILQEKEKIQFNPCFLRLKETQILVLENKNELRWVESKVRNKEELSRAILHILSSIQSAFAVGCYTFMPSENEVTLEIAQLLGMLRDNISVGKLLHRDRALRDEWIKVHYWNLYQRSLQRVESLLTIVKDTKISLDIIHKELSKYQQEQVEQIKTSFCDSLRNVKTLGDLHPQKVLEIIGKLDLTGSVGVVDHEALVTVLKQVLFTDPTKVFGFNSNATESFDNFFSSCEEKLDGYLYYIRSIFEEDPKKEFSILEYFINKSDVGNRLFYPISNFKHPDFTPILSEDLKTKLQGLFQSDAYLGCMTLLTQRQDKCITDQSRGFVSMNQQICMRGINLLHKKNLINELEYIEMRKKTLELTEAQDQLEKIPDILNSIAKKFK